ncbi:uncharacterized protein [Palaemon carinicauda]|uniref:uncharacterized protein n=1 Tax=Palaemon carinicauda TaxID=392227 RepID=UPI0035B5A213
MDYIERDGIAVLRLTPVIKDEKKCVDYPTGNMKLCYEFSEVHWGRTNEEGSDHSVGGYNYPMEVQHYLHRTNLTHSLLPVAVGVMFKEMSDEDSPHLPSISEGAFAGIHEKYPSFMEDKVRLTLSLALLLPSPLEDEPFYHYRGPVTGECGTEREWIVFENPLEVFPSFLSFLKFLNEKDELNHHFPPVSRKACYLYSHYPEETEDNDCGFSEPIDRMKSGNQPWKTFDNLMGKIKHVRGSVTNENSSASVEFLTESSGAEFSFLTESSRPVETDLAGMITPVFVEPSMSLQVDSVSTQPLNIREIAASSGTGKIVLKEASPVTHLQAGSSSAVFLSESTVTSTGEFRLKETPPLSINDVSSMLISSESAPFYETRVDSMVNLKRTIPSLEVSQGTSSLLTSTPTQELMQPATVTPSLYPSENTELLQSLAKTYNSIVSEYSLALVQDDDAEYLPLEGKEPELVTAPEHYVREKHGSSRAFASRRASELTVFVILITRILFW